MPKRAQCIAFASHKGGTGKTTSCVSIAGYLAKKGDRVLVVDMDPQANATSGLGIDSKTLTCSMYDVILDYCDGYEGVPITEAMLETDVEMLHLAPSELDLSIAEVLMHHSRDKDNILNRILEEVRSLYEYILIDVPSKAGLFLINSLRASDQVVVPLDPSIYSLEGLENLETYCRDIEHMTGHTISAFTVVLNRFNKPNWLIRPFCKAGPSEEIEATLRGTPYTVFVVPNCNEIYQAQRKGMPISHDAPASKAGKAFLEIAEMIALKANQ